MGDFKKREFGGNKGGFKGGGGGFGGGDRGGFAGGRSKFGRPGNHEFRKAQMFSATCAKCGKPCEVPFRPSGDRPVFCSYCFKNQTPDSRDGAPTSGGMPPRPQTRDFNSAMSGDAGVAASGIIYDLKKQVDAVNTKLDRIMEILKRNGSTTYFSAEKTEDAVDTKSEVKASAEIASNNIVEKPAKKKVSKNSKKK